MLIPNETNAFRGPQANVVVIIVNYCTAALTVNCLSSLAAESENGLALGIVLVDNASPDNSVGILGHAIAVRGWSNWVTLLQAPRNGGFAYGNNLAIAHVMKSANPAASVLLLNPDTLVRPGAVFSLAAWLEQNPQVGIVGSRLLDADDSPQCSAFRFPSLLGELESGARLGVLSRSLNKSVVPMPPCDTPVPVDWVSGACCLIRRSVIEQIGLLDENYFMYYEEVDYCLRAKRHGWEVWHVPQAEVVHLEGAASGIKDTRKPKPRYWYDSRRRYFVKNHGRVFAFCAEVAFLIAYMTWRVRRKLQGKPDCDAKGRIGDGWRHVALSALFDS